MSICPLGHRADGRPFWVMSFGAGDDGGGEGGEGGTGQGGDGGTGSGGGDGDPDPVRAIRQERDAARRQARDFKALAAEFGIQDNHLEGLRELLSGKGQNGKQQQQQQQTAPPVDEDAIRRKVEAEYRTKSAHRVAEAEIRAAAATGFADPDDAALHLRQQLDDLIKDDGEPDTDAIKGALADLLKRKPHLAKQTDRPPSFDGGARGTSGKPEENFSDFVRSQVAAKRGR